MKDENKKDVKQVVIKVTGAPTTKTLGNRLVAYRLAGKLSEDAKFDATTNITTVTIAASEYDARTLQESHDALSAPVAAAVVAPAGDAAPEKKEGEGEAAPEEKKEGE